MSNGSINLPIVIQQAGDVSRVQEATQRAGEVQQQAAGAEVAREQVRQRQAVQSAQRGAADNRVNADQRGRGRGGSPAGGGQGQKRQPGQDQPAPPRPGGGVLDVVV
ncbi:MAG: hypothetical protein ACOZHQ_11800 [Thermodesulfobacteriota bacterium]